MFKKILNFFTESFREEDKSYVPRFNSLQEVEEFLGSIDDNYVSMVKKWFHIVNKKQFLEDPFVFEKYKIMDNQFDIFIESLFVINNCKHEDENEKERIKEFLDNFGLMLNNFENMVSSSVFSKIIKTGNKRNEFNIW